MLKVTDVERLKEFGFRYEEDEYIYDLGINHNGCSYLIIYIEDDGQWYVELGYIDLEFFDVAVGILYDLIKAGVVEKA